MKYKIKLTEEERKDKREKQKEEQERFQDKVKNSSNLKYETELGEKHQGTITGTGGKSEEKCHLIQNKNEFSEEEFCLQC